MFSSDPLVQGPQSLILGPWVHCLYPPTSGQGDIIVGIYYFHALDQRKLLIYISQACGQGYSESLWPQTLQC